MPRRSIRWDVDVRADGRCDPEAKSDGVFSTWIPVPFFPPPPASWPSGMAATVLATKMCFRKTSIEHEPVKTVKGCSKKQKTPGAQDQNGLAVKKITLQTASSTNIHSAENFMMALQHFDSDSHGYVGTTLTDSRCLKADISCGM